MGLLDRFRKPPNPTEGWVRERTVALELDLDANTINGVGLGDSLRGLSFLGPAYADWRSPSCFEFRELGLVVETDTPGGETIDNFVVVTIPDWLFPEFQPYRGVIRFAGSDLSGESLRRVSDVISVFGKPVRQDDDDDETVLFYELGTVGREIELTSKGYIKTFRIYRM
jgi:hypothetical protein